MKRLTDQQLDDARRSLDEATVSLACEGLFLSREQEALFRSFENERLPHAERRRRILARYADWKDAGRKVEAAE